MTSRCGPRASSRRTRRPPPVPRADGDSTVCRRDLPEGGQGARTPPHERTDVHAALRWLRATSGELALDTGRTVLWGESTGGHLGALAALTTTGPETVTVRGCAAWYAPTDLLGLAEDPRGPLRRGRPHHVRGPAARHGTGEGPRARRLIRTTTEGRRVHERAQAAIAVVESVPADRIGKAGADALRQALTADWGRPPLVPAP
ncbi:alpha/beta hydrolase fold domain-containing protein [Streptomyces sp. NPDC086783]|uniref:alpha/beta hydrolase fold domain-containing protein n=1 Tax=Streptomyces sp. NPDC086783 TaxID=3365758 RepID=UPI00382943EA